MPQLISANQLLLLDLSWRFRSQIPRRPTLWPGHLLAIRAIAEAGATANDNCTTHHRWL